MLYLQLKYFFGILDITNNRGREGQEISERGLQSQWRDKILVRGEGKIYHNFG